MENIVPSSDAIGYVHLMDANAFEPGLEFARRLDREDPLAGFRERFHLPRTADGSGEIYLCGHSLGLQPKIAADYVTAELHAWRRLGVKGHVEGDHPWLPYHEFLAEPMAALVGGEPFEVVTMNSLTTNLHLMMVSFYRPTQERHKILMEAHAFPSDHYAMESQIRHHGFDPAESLVLLSPCPGEDLIRHDDIQAMIERDGDAIALVMLPGVQYYTGQVFDMEEITRLGHEAGCRVGFDLAHAAGNIPLELHRWQVDFAVWCTYKYMNGGPGSVAGCFVHTNHGADAGFERFAGWWGQNKASRFEMASQFEPIVGAEGWQLSNPPILALAAVRASLTIFRQAGYMAPLRRKSLLLTGYLEWLLANALGDDMEMITPGEPDRRGAQLSLKVPGGRDLFDRLEAAGVTVDWREPDVIRVAPAPLYNSFEDCYRFAEILGGLMGGAT